MTRPVVIKPSRALSVCERIKRRRAGGKARPVSRAKAANVSLDLIKSLRARGITVK